MSLVEVLVAMVVLIIGVLGVMSMLDTANSVTRENLARDGATGLVREQLERAREMTYSSLATPSTVATTLVAALGDSTSTGVAAFTTTRRGVTYQTVISSCVIDDPSDGVGAATGTPCTPSPAAPLVIPPTVNVPGGGSLAGLNVLGVSLSGTGSVVDAVCSLVGQNSVLDTLFGQGTGLLSSLVSTGADVGTCSNGTQVAIDREPNDATAVTSTVTWTKPKPGKIVQRTVVTGPRVATT